MLPVYSHVSQMDQFWWPHLWWAHQFELLRVSVTLNVYPYAATAAAAATATASRPCEHSLHQSFWLRVMKFIWHMHLGCSQIVSGDGHPPAHNVPAWAFFIIFMPTTL